MHPSPTHHVVRPASALHPLVLTPTHTAHPHNPNATLAKVPIACICCACISPRRCEPCSSDCQRTPPSHFSAPWPSRPCSCSSGLMLPSCFLLCEKRLPLLHFANAALHAEPPHKPSQPISCLSFRFFTNSSDPSFSLPFSSANWLSMAVDVGCRCRARLARPAAQRLPGPSPELAELSPPPLPSPSCKLRALLLPYSCPHSFWSRLALSCPLLHRPTSFAPHVTLRCAAMRETAMLLRAKTKHVNCRNGCATSGRCTKQLARNRTLA